MSDTLGIEFDLSGYDTTLYYPVYSTIGASGATYFYKEFTSTDLDEISVYFYSYCTYALVQIGGYLWHLQDLANDSLTELGLISSYTSSSSDFLSSVYSRLATTNGYLFHDSHDVAFWAYKTYLAVSDLGSEDEGSLANVLASLVGSAVGGAIGSLLTQGITVTANIGNFDLKSLIDGLTFDVDVDFPESIDIGNLSDLSLDVDVDTSGIEEWLGKIYAALVAESSSLSVSSSIVNAYNDLGSHVYMRLVDLYATDSGGYAVDVYVYAYRADVDEYGFSFDLNFEDDSGMSYTYGYYLSEGESIAETVTYEFDSLPYYSYVTVYSDYADDYSDYVYSLYDLYSASLLTEGTSYVLSILDAINNLDLSFTTGSLTIDLTETNELLDDVIDSLDSIGSDLGKVLALLAVDDSADLLSVLASLASSLIGASALVDAAGSVATVSLANFLPYVVLVLALQFFGALVDVEPVEPELEIYLPITDDMGYSDTLSLYFIDDYLPFVHACVLVLYAIGLAVSFKDWVLKLGGDG